MIDPNSVDFDLAPSDGPLVTVARTARGEGRYLERRADAPRYGHIRVEVSPHQGPRTYRFSWRVAEGVLPLSFMRAASLEGVKAALLEPFGDGGRVVHVQVSVVDGSYHETDTDQQAVSVASNLAVRDALRNAHLVRA